MNEEALAYMAEMDEDTLVYVIEQEDGLKYWHSTVMNEWGSIT